MNLEQIKEYAIKIAKLHKSTTDLKAYWYPSDTEICLVEVLSDKDIKNLAAKIERNEFPIDFTADDWICPTVLYLLNEDEFYLLTKGKHPDISLDKDNLQKIEL